MSTSRLAEIQKVKLVSLFIAKNNPPSLAYVSQMAVAAGLSYLIARLFGLPEAYWAPMSTMTVTQSNFDAALPVSLQHFAGTAIGAAVGAVAATYFHENVWSFSAAVFLIGLLCVALRVETSAYRYASITLVIVMLVTRSTSAEAVAIHRFVEVSIGITVALVLFVLWPGAGGTRRVT